MSRFTLCELVFSFGPVKAQNSCNQLLFLDVIFHHNLNNILEILMPHLWNYKLFIILII